MRVISAIGPKLCGPSRSESPRHTFCDLKVGSGCYRSLGNWAPAHATCTDGSSVSSALGPGMRQPGAWHGQLLWLYTWTSSLSRTKATSISGNFEPCQSPAQLFPADIKAGAWTQQGFTKPGWILVKDHESRPLIFIPIRTNGPLLQHTFCSASVITLKWNLLILLFACVHNLTNQCNASIEILRN